MTESEATRIVALLQGAFPNRPLPDSSAEVYALAMADLDAKDVRAAVGRLVQRLKFLPTIAEIRAEVVEARVTLPAPEVAWGLVLRAVGRFGMYRVPEFEHDEVKGAVDAVGWNAICQEETVSATRARWIDAYRSLREKRIELEVTGRYVPPERRLDQGAGQGGDVAGKLLAGRFPSKRTP